MVANGNLQFFEPGMEFASDGDRGNPALTGSAGHFAPEGEIEHDARGLVAALVLCAMCWLALGYFLLG